MSFISLLLEINLQTQKAFDFALEISKELITLAIGIITVSITFTKDILSQAAPKNKNLLSASWLLFFISVIFGIVHMMALTGSLAPTDIKTYTAMQQKEVFISGTARVAAIFQILLFLLAVLLIILYGMKSLRPSKSQAT